MTGRLQNLEIEGLPVRHVLPELRRALSDGDAVLEAPPGAGKTTLVPIALLDEPWLAGRRIIMLEPRRLAVRAAAARMASMLGESVGETVGYRVRLESRVGARTCIEIVTEGILTRMLQDDPMMEGVGLIIFDEFHERNLQADLGLALALDARDGLRPDLRLLLMSATLDATRIADFLGAPLIRSEGRRFDLRIEHRPPNPGEQPADHAARAVVEALNTAGADVLVFLPGEGEIRRLQRTLADAALPDHVDVLPLFGNLTPREQDRAIEGSPPGRRKVVLATNVAESSLTIEGVTAVVDTGLVRRPRFDEGRGMTVLETGRVARASAEQRAGRAGRIAPGLCLRLWSKLEDEHLERYDAPEILSVDLTSPALELARWGVSDARSLRWLDPPPEARLEYAFSVLRMLGAVDEQRRITAHGRTLASIPAHPRLAQMLARAADPGQRRIAAVLAALLSERDVLRSDDPLDPDIRLRIDAVTRGGRSLPADVSIRRGTLDRVKELARRFAGGDVRVSAHEADAVSGRLVAQAFPDRIAMRDGRHFRLRSGDLADVPEHSALATSAFIVAADVGGHGAMRRVYLAAPLDEVLVRELFGDEVEEKREVRWDASAEAVVSEVREELGSLVLSRRLGEGVDPDDARRFLVAFVRERGMTVLPWTDDATRLRERLQFMHHVDPTWPDVAEEALLDDLPSWLGPFLDGMTRAAELRRLDLPLALMTYVGWERASELDRLAPTHVEVPSGSRIRIDYSDPAAPVLPVRIQEMFGETQTPAIGGGRVPLTLHLLSPAHRPAQITSDLAGFWTGAYFDVRRDLRGRYPKHPWPDDPLAAEPTRRTKRGR